MEQNNDELKTHKRRVRYKGKYPRKFSEKYKERNPEKYAATIEKVISKGSTPAGMHIPIMVNEILDFFQIKPGMYGLDVTLGYGGHTAQMLKLLKGEGHLFALDVDPIESVKTKERLAQKGYGEEILTIKQMNFSHIDELMKETKPFDFILADLGVSSMQIDDPERGFSYKNDGPLDLRLNPKEGMAASELLQNLSQEELTGMLQENSDEPYAEEIAKTITTDIKKGILIDTTMKLHNEIEKALENIAIADKKTVVKKSSARVFQALRIDVNHEFEVLYEFLAKLPEVLAPGGKAAILTFHSGEDRLVKKAFKEYYRQGIYESIAADVIRPSKEECFRNSRAHSTKMRWAIKTR